MPPTGFYTALAGAALSVGGSYLSKPKGVSQSKLSTQFYDPDSEFLNAILAQESATGLGYFDRGTYLEASPLKQAVAETARRGILNRKNWGKLQTQLAQVYDYIDKGNIEAAAGMLGPTGWGQLREVVSSSGFENFGDLVRAEVEYRQKADVLEQQINPIVDRTREALNASRGRFADYVKNLPNLLTSDASNPFIKQLTDEALNQANKYRFNPYKGLESARTDALQRALQLIGAEQAIVGGQMNQALPTAQLLAGQSATAAQIGAAQAQMYQNQVLAKQAADNAWRAQLGQSISGLGNSAATLGLGSALGLFDRDKDSGPAAGTTFSRGNTDTYGALQGRANDPSFMWVMGNE